MGESESKDKKTMEERRFDPELLKKGLQCDLDQLEMLKRCSKKGNINEWNEWRLNNPNEDILLEGATLSGLNLKGANFCAGKYENEHKRLIEYGEVYLKNVEFYNTQLQNAQLYNVHIEGSWFYYTHLQGAILHGAIVSRSTTINKHCEIDRFTDFTGIGLSSTRIDPEIKQLLEYNIRRKNWEEWYKEHPKLKYIIRPFWLMSDYGLSTGRIVDVFLGVAFIFANIYYHWGRIAPPGIVDNLFVGRNGLEVPWWLVPLRTFYFSIITMTLGFSDMYANAQSIWGHILITVQALLGYVLLGALVTRFAVLFTAGGPAGRFADEKEKTDKIS